MHDWSKRSEITNIQPLLSWPAVQVVPLDARRELRGVRPPIFPRAGAKVTDHLAPLLLELSDGGGRDIKKVDKIDLNVERGIHRTLELDLPTGAGGWFPPVAGHGGRGRGRGWRRICPSSIADQHRLIIQVHVILGIVGLQAHADFTRRGVDIVTQRAASVESEEFPLPGERTRVITHFHPLVGRPVIERPSPRLVGLDRAQVIGFDLDGSDGSWIDCWGQGIAAIAEIILGAGGGEFDILVPVVLRAGLVLAVEIGEGLATARAAGRSVRDWEQCCDRGYRTAGDVVGADLWFDKGFVREKGTVAGEVRIRGCCLIPTRN